MTFIKLYYRDENKVMRAVEGGKYSRDGRLILVDQSVYTLTSDEPKEHWRGVGKMFWYWLNQKRSE